MWEKLQLLESTMRAYIYQFGLEVFLVGGSDVLDYVVYNFKIITETCVVFSSCHSAGEHI